MHRLFLIDPSSHWYFHAWHLYSDCRGHSLHPLQPGPRAIPRIPWAMHLCVSPSIHFDPWHRRSCCRSGLPDALSSSLCQDPCRQFCRTFRNDIPQVDWGNSSWNECIRHMLHIPSLPPHGMDIPRQIPTASGSLASDTRWIDPIVCHAGSSRPILDPHIPSGSLSRCMPSDTTRLTARNSTANSSRE